MKVITSVRIMQAEAERLRAKGKTIGFVPTMGFLHEGHLSLIRIARKEADVVVASIFVNPTQFGPNEDLSTYPRDFKRDEALLRAEKTDILFYPPAAGMYPEPNLTWVEVEELTRDLCGASRPLHFRGVATVCAKLFHIVKPHFAVFGQKDAQQVLVIKRMVRDLNFDMKIRVGPIVREKDGLAMSSRNTRLSPEERQDAVCLSQALVLAREKIREGERSASRIIEAMQRHIASRDRTRIDYIRIVDPLTLESAGTVDRDVLVALAVFVGRTRLIDNAIIRVGRAGR